MKKEKGTRYDGVVAKEIKFSRQRGRKPSAEQIVRASENAANAETSRHAQTIIRNTLNGLQPKQRRRETLKARGLRLALYKYPDLTAALFRDRLEAEDAFEFNREDVEEEDGFVDIEWDRATESVIISNARKEERISLSALDMALSRARRK